MKRLISVLTMLGLAAAVLYSVAASPVATANGEDYYLYGVWNLGAPGSDHLTGMNGYVDEDGVTGWGDPGDEYIVLTGGPSYGGPHWAYVYRVDTAGDPNMHPDNPEATGPVGARTFTLINSHYMGVYASGHDNAFYVDQTGIYYGPSDNPPRDGALGWGSMMGCGIFHWDFDWNPVACVVPTPAPLWAQTLAHNPATGDWWTANFARDVYKWDGLVWAYQFTHPSLGGGHHDGMEIIRDSLFISDMTSDVIIQYRLDESGNVIDPPPNPPYKTFTYSTLAHVEGMGFGPNRHIWIAGWNSFTIYEIGGGALQQELEGAVPVDIKPTSCRNPLNVGSKGVLPVAILGTDDLDVADIDIGTILLEGIAPIRSAMEDVATPFEPYQGKEDAFDCTTEGPDGYDDLTLKFDKQEVVAALGEVEDGDVLVLHLEGNLTEDAGGTPIVGEDVVVILKKGNPAPEPEAGGGKGGKKK